jgi:LuxR family transcriptional regulator, maltose regulon positive regulatory protein
MTSIASELPAGLQRGSGREPGRPRFLDDKLAIPRPSFPILRRSRVTGLISDAAARHRVTLICAPTGSGKTVACASWARDGDRPAAERIVWVTADGQDGREWFWAYLCAGMRRARVGPPEVIHSLEDASPVGFPLRLIGAAKLFSEPVVLVLDNVHEMTDESVLNGLAFLIHHAPQGLRLVLAGWRMPAGLQLARLPVCELADIGPRQLACTADEADAYLARLGLEVDAAERDELLRQTGGCIARLRLAALRADANAGAALNRPVPARRRRA